MSDQLTTALDEAPLSRFHTRSVVVAGMGFFTDAYDLFIIGTATTLIAKQWHLSSSETGLVNSITLISAFVGAFIFGRVADVLGRKKIYGLEAALMVGGALASAFAPSLAWLLAFRFILGIGVGGDYPMSAVLMSEFSNRRNRGKLVGLVFSMQALGTVAGYVAALALLSAGVNHDVTWRILLGLGALPAAGVVLLRRRMPESPRYQAKVEGQRREAAVAVASYSEGAVQTDLQGISDGPGRRIGLWQFLSTPRYLLYLAGTAGAWFVFDYAYYGNSVSAPLIVKSVLGSHGAHVLTEALALQLIVFSVAAVPGYYLAAFAMDRIGHRRLQLIGFPLMGLAFLLIGVIPGITAAVGPFLILFGMSYFFAEFGPNTTTFVLAGEVYPTSARSTGHGISAGVAKVGAFIGVYLFPVIKDHLGVAGALKLSAGFALVGALLTLLVPEPARRSLDELSPEDVVEAAGEVVRAAQQPVPGAVPPGA
ncbi:MFS transporter [Aciditerrimonas ferrireducens]|uniref:MFS transporter n=1 Tax=Aciditerrimonas ferrireducens TaxID=667306 RepID=A0ABV6C5F1_9ACTN|nr:MFS transporter [Aciditerrimonas ferrireducens]MCK4177029.1 MFS transporter [Aciditerrimonas ferrireducens]